MNALIFAHQGGWDEMLLVAVPIAAFALAMRTANRRARRVADRVDADRDRARADSTEPSPPGYVDTER